MALYRVELVGSAEVALYLVELVGSAEVARYRVELVCFAESLALSAALALEAALIERVDHLRPQRRHKQHNYVYMYSVSFVHTEHVHTSLQEHIHCTHVHTNGGRGWLSSSLFLLREFLLALTCKYNKTFHEPTHLILENTLYNSSLNNQTKDSLTTGYRL